MTESTAAAEKTEEMDVETSEVESADAEEKSDDDDACAEKADKPARRRRPVPPERVALVVGLIAVLALGGLTGILAFRAYQSHQAEVQQRVFMQVAQQGAVNLTTIDYQHADADVQRILDSATGQFYDEFAKRSQPFVYIVTQAQSKSVGTVTEAGLESVNGDEAQVVVAMRVNTSIAGTPDQQPRLWRMRMTVTEVDGDVKVSKVGFVS